MFRRVLVAVALASVTAAPLSAKCWSPAEVKAAKVRDLQTALMVGALQCRGSRHDVLQPYNQFVRGSRDTISAHNDVLKARFVKAGGGQRGYDKFTTALANDHAMTAAGSSDFCAGIADLAREAADVDSRGELEAIAERRTSAPLGVDDSCQVASLRP